MDDAAIFDAINNEGVLPPVDAIQKAQSIVASDVANEVCRDAMAAKHDQPTYIYEGKITTGKDKGKPDGTYHIDYMAYSDFLKSIYHIYNFKKNLFIYDGERGVYKYHTNEIGTHTRDTVKKYMVSDRLTAAERETITHVKNMGCVDSYPFIGTFGTIHVLNGSLCLDTGVITPTTPDMLYDYRIETEYKQFPDGTPELDAFLSQYGTREPINVLAKCIWQRAHHDTLKEITVFYGPKDSGKTTLAELVQATMDGDSISRKNVSRTLLHELLQRFGYADLEGKLLNYGDDLPDMFIKNSGRLNSLVGSVNQHVEKKGLDGYDAIITAYYLFSANNLPPLDDDDSVIWAKIHLVEFFKPISSERVVREKLFTPIIREQLLYRAIETVLSWKSKPYTNNQDADWVRDKWHEATTDVDAFLLECTVPSYTSVPVSLEIIKDVYTTWCAYHGKTRHMKYLNKKVQPFLRRTEAGNAYTLLIIDPKKPDTAPQADLFSGTNGGKK